MTQQEADELQNWRGMDGSTAYQLIERHANDWDEIGLMMNAWLRANRTVNPDCAPQPTPN